MSSSKFKRAKRQLRAVLYNDGVPAPANRPRYASYGAGVAVPGAPTAGVNVVSEGGGKSDQHPITLTRFAAGAVIPATYRKISEAAAED